MSRKRFNLNQVRSFHYTKNSTGYLCMIAEDLTATIVRNTDPTGRAIRNSFKGYLNGECVGAGTLNDCKVQIGFRLLDLPCVGELNPAPIPRRDLHRPCKMQIDYLRDRVDEITEQMDDAENNAGVLNDKLFYANQLAEAKDKLKALEARAHIYMSDYVKRCPVVGTYVLENPHTVTKTFEQAAWYEDIDLAPGVYEVRADLDRESGRPRIKGLFIPMAGYIRKANFPSVCGGMQYQNKRDAEMVGKPDYYTMTMSMDHALKYETGVGLSFWIKWEQDGPFYYLTEQPVPEDAPTHPAFPGEKLERIELVNPTLSGGTMACTVDGERIAKRYINYEMPPQITRAIGIGCTAGLHGVVEGSPTPAVWCAKRQNSKGETYYIAVYYAGYKRPPFRGKYCDGCNNPTFNCLCADKE